MTSNEIQNDVVLSPPKKYVLLPEFNNNISIVKFVGVTIAYLGLLFAYVLTATYYDSFTPFTGNVFESPMEAQRRLKNHVNMIVTNKKECFTVNNKETGEIEEIKENTTIFDKLRNYINRFITNLFYIKGNTVAFTT